MEHRRLNGTASPHSVTDRPYTRRVGVLGAPKRTGLVAQFPWAWLRVLCPRRLTLGSVALSPGPAGTGGRYYARLPVGMRCLAWCAFISSSVISLACTSALFAHAAAYCLFGLRWCTVRLVCLSGTQAGWTAGDKAQTPDLLTVRVPVQRAVRSARSQAVAEGGRLTGGVSARLWGKQLAEGGLAKRWTGLIGRRWGPGGAVEVLYVDHDYNPDGFFYVYNMVFACLASLSVCSLIVSPRLGEASV